MGNSTRGTKTSLGFEEGFRSEEEGAAGIAGSGEEVGEASSEDR